ncbi:MAG: DUF1573 domain-containing protein [Betaproteobacteria bacterium]|nr:DUF1573 domain-containing protein [Betaproteobacteria bacterium]
MKPSRVMNGIFYGLIAFSVIVIALGIFRSRENVAKPRPEPVRQVAATGSLQSSEPYFDFGNISMAAGKVSHSFRIRNTGDSAITVTKLYTSCMCTTATLITPAGRKGPFGMPGHGFNPGISQTVAPGGNAQVEVVFDPAAHGPAGIGPTERVVTVQISESAPLELRFAAMVKP